MPVKGSKKSSKAKAAPKKQGRKRDAAKVSTFVERAAQHGNGARAAREAGFAEERVASAVAASRLMADPDIRARVERRREEALRRAGMETDVIIGSLAEISTASLADVLEADGSFDIVRCVERGTDHLLKKYKRREFHTKQGELIVTHEFEMYDRLGALSQLRDTYGMKEETRPNSLDERRRREVEASLERIMERDRVDKPTAAKMLLESLKSIPNSEKAIEVVSAYVN
jgi:hypothetical protein